MCYIVPAIAAITTTFAWRTKRTLTSFWLMLMFFGGSLFGIVDHLWNGELFLISANWLKDLALGAVITVVIILAWAIILAMAKKNPSFVSYPGVAEVK
ncbi:MAG: hypothetical protein KKH29_01245 [Candidatus Omnitrophica bacterium]|nr:hypothetical protein [Candidatus Omnitrophota bacterium]MBU4345936.1 hypothetical protein [Candidatus Omnitrophota bacterium]MBU4473368.1 hypothetical protein [Candidatus Omnitrophota bacterium]MCG2706496.1 hypothetical protein [Candidatus Omnitrophota bacterium]